MNQHFYIDKTLSIWGKKNRHPDFSETKIQSCTKSHWANICLYYSISSSVRKGFFCENLVNSQKIIDDCYFSLFFTLCFRSKCHIAIQMYPSRSPHSHTSEAAVQNYALHRRFFMVQPILISRYAFTSATHLSQPSASLLIHKS